MKSISAKQNVISKHLITAAVAASLTAFASASNAGIITWGVPTSAAVANDVATEGTLVEAFNMGAAAASDVTINGVDFVATNSILSNSSNNDFFSGSTGDAGYDNLLSTLDFGNGTDFSFNIGGGSLIAGWEYLVQVWFTDTRDCCSDRAMTVGDGDEGSSDVTLLASSGGRVGAGQFAVGTFTADDANQVLSLQANNFSNVHLNGYQLRAIEPTDVPAPAPLAMLGLGLIALRLARRQPR